VRGLMCKLETATDDTRTALATHGLPDILDAMNPGYRPELPEIAKMALADDFVQRGLAGQLQSMTDTLGALREQVRLKRLTPHVTSWGGAHIARSDGAHASAPSASACCVCVCVCQCKCGCGHCAHSKWESMEAGVDVCRMHRKRASCNDDRHKVCAKQAS
jgi:hypothetical protein